MNKSRFFRRILLWSTLVLLALLLASSSFYIYWSAAPPSRTCKSCHEIANSYDTWKLSAHRNINCDECHGTALSNGFHSLSEKFRMVRTHFTEEHITDLKLSEAQVLESMESCRQCHQSAYSNWLAGGHSADYASIFLLAGQNSSVQLNADCLRCHGMFFGETINKLVEPLDMKGPWHLREKEKAAQPAIPCMACHHLHAPGNVAVRPDYERPGLIAHQHPDRIPAAGFYGRADEMHFHCSVLPEPEIFHNGRQLQVSGDVRQRVCMQCHAPGADHQSGTSDDRTPRGVHEGISCLSCHQTHNNDTRSSCRECHPSLSNCGLDVTTMNTSFADPDSRNNIHFVSCEDCHGNNLNSK